MSTRPDEAVLRPAASWPMRALMRWVLNALPVVFRLLRDVMPIPGFGKYFAVTRYDDVREVFANSEVFGVPYNAKLDVIMGGQPFFLGIDDRKQHDADADAMRRVMRGEDLALLGSRAEAMAEAVIATSGGRLEIVDTLVRRVTFGFLAEYLGVPEPPGGSIAVWGTRLFEYQFVASDAPLLAEVQRIAPLLRRHIQGEIERRRGEISGPDDVLGRCLELQRSGEAGFTDDSIRTALMGFIVGGPPQPPMVLPQAMEQLLRRPAALAGAQAAARAGDDDLLIGHVLEAMRFDPLAPGVPRLVIKPWMIARGTPHQRSVPIGATVLTGFASAMRDERRVPDPETFNPRRLPHEYMHFGYGMHRCFGLYINQATLHRILKPLLKRQNLRRADGPEGKLRKRGAFAESLWLTFD